MSCGTLIKRIFFNPERIFCKITGCNFYSRNLDHMIFGDVLEIWVSPQFLSGSDADGPTFEMMHCTYIYLIIFIYDIYIYIIYIYVLGVALLQYQCKSFVCRKSLLIQQLTNLGWKISKTITSILAHLQ